MKSLKLVILLFIICIIIQSCRKDDEFTKAGIHLKFSTDSLDFDTIFSMKENGGTEPLSITLQLRVTNPDAYAVKTNIRMKGNQYGIYKLNADGRSGNGPFQEIDEVEIRGKDSIFIFVQAYINQISSNVPFVVADQILFETNGVIQDVDIISYPQDANYLRDSVLATGTLNWSNSKPYVIYNSILIPEGCTLNIPSGTKIYSHTQSVILVEGTLNVQGNVLDPVVFQGDRLEDDYKDVFGQWIGIWFRQKSKNNVIQGAVIKNGYLGIRADSSSVNGNPKLTLKQTIIKNMSAVGLLCYSADIKAENNLIVNCGQYTFVGELGGTYELTHNTFAAYNGQTGRQNPSFYLSNSPYKDSAGTPYKFPLNYTLINNIIYGPNEDEIYFNKEIDGGTITETVKNNAIRTKEFFNYLSVSTSSINQNMLNIDPLFSETYTSKFDLKAGTPCKGKGLSGTGINIDLKDISRTTNPYPTIGAYEAP